MTHELPYSEDEVHNSEADHPSTFLSGRQEVRGGVSDLPVVTQRDTLDELARNIREVEFLSAIDDPSNGIDKLNKITRTVHEEARSYRGFNFFNRDDGALFLALARGEFTISGVRNKTLRLRFPQYNSGQMSRILRRLRPHGLIKKASHCYKYYLTVLCKQVVALGLKTQGTGHHSGASGCPSR
jgi:hypothetical protein